VSTEPATESPQFVRVERDGPVAVVRLDRPKVNALSRELLDELADAFGTLSADLPGAVVIWGGDRMFAAGADITEFLDEKAADLLTGSFSRAFDAVAALPRATIAAIAGYALGGGCELALACDFRIATTTAKLGQAEVLLGLIPGAGGTQRLTHLIGPARAKDLIFTGRNVEADEALRIGLVDRVVEPDRLLDEAVSFASKLASGAVLAQGLAKRAVEQSFEVPLKQGLITERELFFEALRSNDAQNGIRTFLEKGPGQARFSGA